MLVSTEYEQRIRSLELKLEQKDKELEYLKSRKHSRFSVVFDEGHMKLAELAKSKVPAAAALYHFLSANTEFGSGGVVISQQALADELGVSVRTVQRWSDALEEKRFIVRLPVVGKLYAYCLNPDIVFRGYKDSKKMASFNTKTFTTVRGNELTKLRLMFKKD